MFILCLTGKPEKIFSVMGPDEDQVVPMFTEEEDAERYAYMVDELNELNLPELDVIDVDISVDKTDLKRLMQSLYIESCEVV